MVFWMKLSNYSFFYLSSILLQNCFYCFYYHYQNKYNGNEEILLFKVGFNSLIKTLSWISSFKLHDFVGRIEKSSRRTTILQKSIWSHAAEVWVEKYQFFPRFTFYKVVWFTNVFSIATDTLNPLLHKGYVWPFFNIMK